MWTINGDVQFIQLVELFSSEHEHFTTPSSGILVLSRALRCDLSHPYMGATWLKSTAERKPVSKSFLFGKCQVLSFARPRSVVL